MKRKDRLKSLRGDLAQLMNVPGLSGHEDRIRQAIRKTLEGMGQICHADVLGNLWTTIPGDPQAPSVMLFTHMDQLGFIVSGIDRDGFIRIERLGGVPERALPAQSVLIYGADDLNIPGIIAHKSHHATAQDDKYRVLPYRQLFIDAGFRSHKQAIRAGVKIGLPVVYRPNVQKLAGDRMAGTSVDDRAGCAILLAVATQIRELDVHPTVHIVFSVQEEFNLRGAAPVAERLKPDMALQIDLALTGDTPDMFGESDVRLGQGPAISLYSFHGRGTLNGVIPHPALVSLFERTSRDEKIKLQRSARVGVLTDLSYVQLCNNGIAALDLCFPMRYSHSANEVCDLRDLDDLTRLILASLPRITPEFSLLRDEVPS